VLRAMLRSGKLSVADAALAIADLRRIPIQRSSHRALIERCWQLRDNLTPYDASYVALAELLSVSLVTADARIARASGIRCTVEVLR
jgi:predicted nucleic acid-binding protein